MSLDKRVVLKRGDRVLLAANGIFLQQDMKGWIVKVNGYKIHVHFDDWPYEAVFDGRDNELRKYEEQPDGLPTPIDGA